MKYLKQFAVILSVSVAGELLRHLLPFPIPASIYGVAILFLLLESGLLKLASVKAAGDFLLEIMPVMFIPPAVGLIETWHSVAPRWFQYFLIAFVATFVVMFVSGKAAQAIAKRKERQDAADA